MDLGCIFNWDGAVVSSIDKHLEAWSLLAEETNQSLPNEFIEEAFGKNPLWILSNLLQWTDKNDDIFHLRNRREAIYRKIIQKDPPILINGVKSFIKDLVENEIPCVVATSLSRVSYDLEANLTDMNGLFSAIVSAENYRQEKPHPEIYLKCSKAIHVASSQGVVFENTPFGIEGASVGGFQIVSIDPSNATKNNEDTDLVIADYLKVSYQTIENL